LRKKALNILSPAPLERAERRTFNGNRGRKSAPNALLQSVSCRLQGLDASQRSLLSRELRTDRIKVAVLLSDPKLLMIVKISSWFHARRRGVQGARAREGPAVLG
jgi:hypothetical protein